MLFKGKCCLAALAFRKIFSVAPCLRVFYCVPGFFVGAGFGNVPSLIAA